MPVWVVHNAPLWDSRVRTCAAGQHCECATGGKRVCVMDFAFGLLELNTPQHSATQVNTTQHNTTTQRNSPPRVIARCDQVWCVLVEAPEEEEEEEEEEVVVAAA